MNKNMLELILDESNRLRKPRQIEFSSVTIAFLCALCGLSIFQTSPIKTLITAAFLSLLNMHLCARSPEF